MVSQVSLYNKNGTELYYHIIPLNNGVKKCYSGGSQETYLATTTI